MSELPRKLHCSGVSYRQGVIEVIPAIHRGFVNLEAWQTSPDSSATTAAELAGGAFPEGAIIADVELELSPAEARRLGHALLDAADVAELPVFELEGDAILTLQGFFDEISRVLIPGEEWGHNLDAFNDILRGGFGTPDDGYLLIWNHHESSRDALGYAETARELERRLEGCHASSRESVAHDLDLARREIGPTVFDWLVEIISDHGPGGTEAADGVRLELR
jgi:hypothetical protein